MTEQEIYQQPDYIASMNSIQASFASINAIMASLKAKYPPPDKSAWAIVGDAPKLVKLGANLGMSV